MGEPGAKNGEKKLRSGLSHSDEWACSVTRNRTADALEAAARAPGAPQGAVADAATLAAALRSRDSAKLRKRHMLALVRAWHYKSDVWRRKHARGEYRRAAQEEEAAAVALALHSTLASGAPPGRLGAIGASTRASGASTFSAIAALGSAVAPSAMMAFAVAELRPLAAAAAGWLRGTELRAAMTLPSSSGAAAVARQADAAHHQGCADVCAGLRGEVANAAATLRAWKAELARMAPTESAQPAWAGLSALHDGCLVEAALLRLRRVLSVAAGVAQTLHVPSQTPMTAGGGAAGAAAGLLAASGARPMEAAAAARGLAAAYGSAQEWLARAMTALVTTRLAPVSVYLEIAATLGDETAAFLIGWESAARDRAAWINAAISSHAALRGGGASSLLPPQGVVAGAPQMTAAQLAAALELAPGLPGMAAAVAALCAAHLPRLQAQSGVPPHAPPRPDA